MYTYAGVLLYAIFASLCYVIRNRSFKYVKLSSVDKCFFQLLNIIFVAKIEGTKNIHEHNILLDFTNSVARLALVSQKLRIWNTNYEDWEDENLRRIVMRYNIRPNLKSLFNFLPEETNS